MDEDSQTQQSNQIPDAFQINYQEIVNIKSGQFLRNIRFYQNLPAPVQYLLKIKSHSQISNIFSNAFQQKCLYQYSAIFQCSCGNFLGSFTIQKCLSQNKYLSKTEFKQRFFNNSYLSNQKDQQFHNNLNQDFSSLEYLEMIFQNCAQSVNIEQNINHLERLLKEQQFLKDYQIVSSEVINKNILKKHQNMQEQLAYQEISEHLILRQLNYCCNTTNVNEIMMFQIGFKNDYQELLEVNWIDNIVFISKKLSIFTDQLIRTKVEDQEVSNEIELKDLKNMDQNLTNIEIQIKEILNSNIIQTISELNG